MIKALRLRSIQRKLITYIAILMFIVTFVAGTVQYMIRSNQLFAGLRAESSRLAAVAALLIDGDSHQSLTTPQDQFSATYEEIRAKMQKFKGETGVKYIYTLVQDGNDQTRFIIDADEDD